MVENLEKPKHKYYLCNDFERLGATSQRTP